MPRFTVKDLLLATTLIAAGIGGWCLVARLNPSLDSPWLLIPGFLTSVALIGAGIGNLWQKKKWGAVLAIVAAVLVSLALGSEAHWSGHFTLSVQVVSPNKEIRSVSCFTDFRRQVGEVIVAKLDLGRDGRWSAVVDQFDGAPISFDVTSGGVDGIFRHTYHYERWLVVLVEFEEGTRAAQLVEIPEGHGSRSVTVTFP